MRMGRRRNLVRHNNNEEELNTTEFPEDSLTNRVMCSIVTKKKMQGERSQDSIHEPMRTCRTTSPSIFIASIKINIVINTDVLNRPTRASRT